MFGGNMHKEDVLTLRQSGKIINEGLDTFRPTLDGLLAKKGFKKDGKKNALYDKTESMIENCIYRQFIENPRETSDMIAAFRNPSELPIYPLNCDYWQGTLEELLPKGSPFKNNTSFNIVCHTLWNISNKGIGKGELLSAFLFGNSVKVDSTRDCGFRDGNAEERIAEIKAENATLKGTRSARKDVIDSLNEELSLVGPIFDEDCLHIVKEFFEIINNMSVANQEELVKAWSSLTPAERKQRVGAMIHQNYQEIDGFGSYCHWSYDGKNDNFQLVIVNDWQNPSTKELERRFKYSPQTKRGGCTQAVGDGYTDAQINPNLFLYGL